MNALNVLAVMSCAVVATIYCCSAGVDSELIKDPTFTLLVYPPESWTSNQPRVTGYMAKHRYTTNTTGKTIAQAPSQYAAYNNIQSDITTAIQKAIKSLNLPSTSAKFNLTTDIKELESYEVLNECVPTANGVTYEIGTYRSESGNIIRKRIEPLVCLADGKAFEDITKVPYIDPVPFKIKVYGGITLWDFQWQAIADKAFVVLNTEYNVLSDSPIIISAS
uniref:FTP domain-containing protein n=1 Tax=Rhabditophanes sp. KR3021 TaxID=114890 RepID=A0AC35TVZ6_9BILA